MCEEEEQEEGEERRKEEKNIRKKEYLFFFFNRYTKTPTTTTIILLTTTSKQDIHHGFFFILPHIHKYTLSFFAYSHTFKRINEHVLFWHFGNFPAASFSFSTRQFIFSVVVALSDIYVN
jgi:hypothetical protein